MGNKAATFKVKGWTNPAVMPVAGASNLRLVKKRRQVLRKTSEVLQKFVVYSFLSMLIGLSLTLLVLNSYRTYMLAKVSLSISNLRSEYQGLKKEYAILTSKDILRQKAKALGLRPPTKSDVIILR